MPPCRFGFHKSLQSFVTLFRHASFTTSVEISLSIPNTRTIYMITLVVQRLAQSVRNVEVWEMENSVALVLIALGFPLFETR